VKRGSVAAALVLVAGACGGEPPPAAGGGDTGGEPYHITATIEEVMRYLVDPASDAIWESVVTDVTAAGVVEHVPETDEDWATLRGHGLVLAEATNLLLMPDRPVASADSRSEMPGVDLEPEQIEALLAQDRDAWDAFVGGLHTSVVAVLDAVERRDVDALLTAGDGLDLACENCHVRYWYPSLESDR